MRAGTARYNRQGSDTPFNLCSPAPSNTIPEPAARSLIVPDTNTSCTYPCAYSDPEASDVVAVQFHFSGMQASAHRE